MLFGELALSLMSAVCTIVCLAALLSVGLAQQLGQPTLLLHSASSTGPYVPDQLASTFSVPTINGTVFTFNMETLQGCPLLVFALNDSDPFTLYTATNPPSVDEWLSRMPENTQYLFFS